jgi:hypothetical protein
MKYNSWFWILSLILKQFASDNSDDSDSTVKKMRNGMREGEDETTIYYITGPDPGLIHVVAPDINGDSLSLTSSG